MRFYSVYPYKSIYFLPFPHNFIVWSRTHKKQESDNSQAVKIKLEGKWYSARPYPRVPSVEVWKLSSFWMKHKMSVENQERFCCYVGKTPIFFPSRGDCQCSTLSFAVYSYFSLRFPPSSSHHLDFRHTSPRPNLDEQ